MGLKRKRGERPAAARDRAPVVTAGQVEDGGDDEEVPTVDCFSAYNALLSSLGSSKASMTSSKMRKQEEVLVREEDRRNNVEETGNFYPDSEQDVGQDMPQENDASIDEDPSINDGFTMHLEHSISEEEIRRLDSGTSKFSVKLNALGIRKAKWITNSENISLPQKNTLSKFSIKEKLKQSWLSVVKGKYGDFRSEQQFQFFALCCTYRDILHSRKASLLGTKGASEVMDAYLLHALNHVLKTRDLVVKNNSKADVPRDQGFTRPKVLFLLPIRSTALNLMKRLIDLFWKQKSTVEHKQKFLDEFGLQEEPDTKKAIKPADYLSFFGGNNDDHFRLGIKLAKNSIKLYSDFYTSDIIIASPLGLMTAIGEAEAEHEKDLDFLSSIEILVSDFTDVILMQNWSHVLSIFEHLNKIPSKQHDTDIMRVREWYLNGHARYYRQTIFLSAYPDAQINALFHRFCWNYRGKIKLQCQYDGVLSSVVLQVRQVYERIDVSTVNDADADADARFEFFKSQIFPGIKSSLQGGFLLFVRSYFDFVRLRNFLRSESASFCLLGEYTKSSDISRSRSWFFHGERRIMLYTERAHFYNRFQIRGIRELIFYSLPDHANFYSELTNMLQGVENPSCTIMFSIFDTLQLERIVGSSKARKLLSSNKRTFMFC